MHATLQKLASTDPIVIASIHGAVAGAGMSLCINADLAIASDGEVHHVRVDAVDWAGLAAADSALGGVLLPVQAAPLSYSPEWDCGHPEGVAGIPAAGRLEELLGADGLCFSP